MRPELTEGQYVHHVAVKFSASTTRSADWASYVINVEQPAAARMIDRASDDLGIEGIFHEAGGFDLGCWSKSEVIIV